MPSNITLIGCGIFQEEVEAIMKAEKLNVDIKWLEVGLHDSIERLEESLDEALNLERAQGSSGLGFLYGTACLPEMKVFAAERGVPVLGARNCLAALVGDEELKGLEQNRTLVASPGWVRKMWLGRAGRPGGWTVDDYRLQFGRYDLILVLDPGLEPLTDEEIITCFDLVQVPLEVRPCDLGYFRRIFLKLLDEARGEGEPAV